MKTQKSGRNATIGGAFGAPSWHHQDLDLWPESGWALIWPAEQSNRQLGGDIRGDGGDLRHRGGGEGGGRDGDQVGEEVEPL